MIRLFVYGTLKRGQRNHRMLRAARFLGGHRTEARFSLYDLGGYPGACPNGRRSIEGELFAIGETLLSRLDEFEAAFGLAERLEIVTRHGPAWMYVAERKSCRAKPRIAARR